MLEAVEAPAEARQDPSQPPKLSEHLSGFRGLRGANRGPKGAWKIQKHEHLGRKPATCGSACVRTGKAYIKFVAATPSKACKFTKFTKFTCLYIIFLLARLVY